MGRPKGSKNGVRTLITKACLVCQRPFSLYPSAAKVAVCCSKECDATYKRRVHQSRVEREFGKPIRDVLYDLYHVQRLTSRQVIKALSITTHTFIRWCNLFGIQRRDRSTAVQMQWRDNDSRRESTAILAKKNLAGFGGLFAKNPEVRKKISESKKGARNPMYNHFRELNPNWKGGKMTAYGAAWESAKRQVRRRDHDKCRICNSTKQLEVHHINPYRFSKDNSLANLILLCTQCHRKAERGKINLAPPLQS